MEARIRDFVDSDTLEEARSRFENQGSHNYEAVFEYGKCLERCREIEDIQQGIALLLGLLDENQVGQWQVEVLSYLAIGYTKLQKYDDALKYTEKLLLIDPYNREFKDWKEYLNGKLGDSASSDGWSTFGKVVGGLVLGGLTLWGAKKIGDHFSNSNEAPEPSYHGYTRSSTGSDSSNDAFGLHDGFVAAGASGSEVPSFGRSGFLQGSSNPHVGSEFNQWVRGEASYGDCDFGWEEHIKRSPYVGDFDTGRKQWDRSCRTVDTVKDMLMEKLKSRAKTQYPELRIDKFLLQGSSRDGLKVIAPDEFDVGFEFHVDGINLKEWSIPYENDKIPGFCYLKVTGSEEKAKKNCPQLWKKEVFVKKGDGLYLSSRLIYTKVFKSLMDQSIQELKLEIEDSDEYDFKITRQDNPPAVTIQITFDRDSQFDPPGAKKQPSDRTKCIDVDIIPALRVDVDLQSTSLGKAVKAPIHAICKWKEVESANALDFVDSEDQALVWLLNSVAYERFIFDIARTDTSPKQRYILTALRILKTYMTKAKAKSKAEMSTPPQIATVLKSYHLKQITCYLILYTCYMDPTIDIEGAQCALVFLIGLLETCLKEGKLPHFFYSNSQIGSIFLDYPESRCNLALRFNLLYKISPESKRQALLSLNDLKKALDVSTSNGYDLATLQMKFRDEISIGEYF